jgi:hypothetical protein
MKTNSHCASIVSVPPVLLSRSVMRSRWSSPCAAATSVQVRTEMCGIRSICSTR